MTAVEVQFKYVVPPTEAVLRAIDSVRQVYGIRSIRFQESESVIRVEFDATRLNEASVASLLRRSGLDIREKLELV
ncbi:MAG TPA: hypothetical protein VN622_15200 [Clostridia bacterium]|nr:hypothetical protein [Clostridia bacterium]